MMHTLPRNIVRHTGVVFRYVITHVADVGLVIRGLREEGQRGEENVSQASCLESSDHQMVKSSRVLFN